MTTATLSVLVLLAAHGEDHSRARAAFMKAYPVFMHPRCLNCHPAGDTPLQGFALWRGAHGFDRRNRAVRDRGNRRDTRADWRAVHVHRAGSAGADAAAVLRAGQAQVITQHPQQRGSGIDLDRGGGAVQDERDLLHAIVPSGTSASRGQPLLHRGRELVV
jgi:hypothetical protein